MAINKILIVDDSPTDLSNLESIVSQVGCEVIKASSGAEGLEKARTEKPDIIFMDIVMENIDGYEATRQLTNDATTKAIPVIFVSSKHQKADRVWAKMQGAKELISKPYSPDEILQQIKAYS